MNIRTGFQAESGGFVNNHCFPPPAVYRSCLARNGSTSLKWRIFDALPAIGTMVARVVSERAEQSGKQRAADVAVAERNARNWWVEILMSAACFVPRLYVYVVESANYALRLSRQDQDFLYGTFFDNL